MIWKALVAFSLLILPSVALAHPLYRAAEGLQCYQPPAGDWTLVEQGPMKAAVWEDPTHRKFKGPVHQTFGLTNAAGQVVQFALVFEADPKYRQAKRAFRSLRRKFGEPAVMGNEWAWMMESGGVLVMKLPGDGTAAVILVCP